MYTRGWERELIQDVAVEARALGYQVRTEVRGMFRGRYQPDILIQKGGKTILIEVKTSPIALAHVAQLGRLRADKVVICIPSDALVNTAGSVLNYADKVGVQICPIEAIGSVIE